jgi:hypothetical protein
MWQYFVISVTYVGYRRQFYELIIFIEKLTLVEFNLHILLLSHDIFKMKAQLDAVFEQDIAPSLVGHLALQLTIHTRHCHQ